MEGLIEEGSEIMEEDFEGALLDAALIGAAQRVEHYEIAAYGTVRAFAEELGESEHASLLAETLEEEKETDEKLTELAKQINVEADEGSGQAEEKQKTHQNRNVHGRINLDPSFCFWWRTPKLRISTSPLLMRRRRLRTWSRTRRRCGSRRWTAHPRRTNPRSRRCRSRCRRP